MKAIFVSASLAALTAAAPAFAVKVTYPYSCADNTQFSRWVEDLRVEALKTGVSPETWAVVEQDIKINQTVLALDKRQGGFYKSFLEFALPRVHKRLERAKQVKKAYQKQLDVIEAKTGVPGSVLISFWGMETDFADRPGKAAIHPVIQSMTTLAYDCRRSPLFRENLLNALRMVEKGYVSIDKFNGEPAGETSGLQFTPSLIYKYGVSYSGQPIPDVVKNVDDMLMTAANVFKNYGWKAGQPITQEVILPENFRASDYAKVDFPRADKQNPLIALRITQSVSEWYKLGVRGINKALPNGDLQAALVLPLGAKGPAFLAYPNFNAMMAWNNSLNNALTGSYFASRLGVIKGEAPAGEMYQGKEQVYYLSQQEMTELQQLLYVRPETRALSVRPDIVKEGIKFYDERGAPLADGKLGTGTRLAVREFQLATGMIPDGYPSIEVLQRLQQGR